MSDEPEASPTRRFIFSGAWERPIVSKQNDKTYTQDDIGSQVTLNIDGVALNDVVVEVALPGRGSIIGPNVRVCAHIFARLTMMEAMMAASAHASKERDDWSDEMA